jgi:hypothetical protein
MMQKFSRLWREPLLHFLLIGMALFVYYDVARDGTSAAPKRIHVGSGEVQQLVANYQRTWSRPPTPAQLDAMIESHVREEVFYREALAMGLDQNDPLVRRRMRMKLEFILEDLSSQDPGDAQLQDFLQQNAADFRRDALVSFRQVYLNPDKRAQLPDDAQQLLVQLNNGANAEMLGDPTMAPRAYDRARQSEIARDFGVEFASEVARLPVGQWLGPIYSPFGAHLLRIDARVEARLPQLAEIRDEVLRDYVADQRQQQKNLAYARLREGYVITIDPLEPETDNVIPGAGAAAQ